MPIVFIAGAIVAYVTSLLVQVQHRTYTGVRWRSVHLLPIVLLGLWFISCWNLQLPLHYYLFGTVSLYLSLWDWLKLQVPIDGLVLLTCVSGFALYDGAAAHLYLILLLPICFLALTLLIYKIKRLPIEIPWGDVWALACLGAWISDISEFLIIVGVTALLTALVRKQDGQLPFIPALCFGTAIDILW